LILLAAGSGPGALQAPQIAAELASTGHRVEVAFAPGANRFVGPAAFTAFASLFEEATEPPEAVVFAPATAGTLARLTWGLGARTAEQAYITGIRPAIVATELDEATRKHPAVRENVELLRKDGYRVLEGLGENMASPKAIVGEVFHTLGGPLSGLRVLITAGGTREPIDKVRVVSNRSSGKMGRALAHEAFRCGAEVTVVAANVEEKEPGVSWVDVETYEEIEETTMRLAPHADVLIMAAAISDFTPETVEEGKIRRGGAKGINLKLVATGDILQAVRESNPNLFMIGFAATYGDSLSDAREKLKTKGVDLVVGNDISISDSGFGSDENEVVIVGQDGERFVPRAEKTVVARAILDALEKKTSQESRQEQEA